MISLICWILYTWLKIVMRSIQWFYTFAIQTNYKGGGEAPRPSCTKNHTEINKIYSCSPPKKKRQTKVQVCSSSKYMFGPNHLKGCWHVDTSRVTPETYPIKRSNIKQDQDNWEVIKFGQSQSIVQESVSSESYVLSERIWEKQGGRCVVWDLGFGEGNQPLAGFCERRGWIERDGYAETIECTVVSVLGK